MSYRKKLIEVSLPLNKINAASTKEKSIRYGHPSTFHLWWARRPLASCRAVLFASLIDDPSENTERFPTEEAQNAERKRHCRHAALIEIGQQRQRITERHGIGRSRRCDTDERRHASTSKAVTHKRCT